ncbi:lipase family protein [Aurantivibrio plasticivorans]
MARVAANIAAKLAADVYGVQDSIDLNLFMMSPQFSQKKGDQTALAGEVGSRLVNTRDSFAVCARGAGEYANDVFLMFRGTTTSNYGADIVTDLRCGLSVSKTGSFVHSGFNQVFSSLCGDLARFLAGQTGVTAVHCIGHSLGGAVASLAADWVKDKFSVKTQLYTFGAPRVGFGVGGFGQALTSKLKAENIYRMYHSTDPVTMVPVFPYSHAPTSGRAYYMQFGGILINLSAHKMRNYIGSIKGNDWEAVYQPNPIQNSAAAIKAWLTSDSADTVQSSSFWEKLNFALSHVIQMLIAKTQAVVVGALTIADHLAIILKKGIQLGGEAATWVFLLIKRMMRALGMKVAETIEELTEALIRMVLNRITERIAREVRKAIEHML